MVTQTLGALEASVAASRGRSLPPKEAQVGQKIEGRGEAKAGGFLVFSWEERWTGSQSVTSRTGCGDNLWVLWAAVVIIHLFSICPGICSERHWTVVSTLALNCSIYTRKACLENLFAVSGISCTNSPASHTPNRAS